MNDPYERSAEYIDIVIADAWSTFGPTLTDELRGVEAVGGTIVDLGAQAWPFRERHDRDDVRRLPLEAGRGAVDDDVRRQRGPAARSLPGHRAAVEGRPGARREERSSRVRARGQPQLTEPCLVPVGLRLGRRRRTEFVTHEFPSLPGFGFSGPLTRTGVGYVETAAQSKSALCIRY
ncbi:hypothetical protein SVIO_024370 [Streptomyces violaceusniger]|uniref:Uncharacterized protein n=1 Tax=Streptomyces violaceusniger TaxID=68280 RepID=A0A4D4KUI0_STRVO|nr:hypothetical protein SVIO_024370 [Streptomyces violaceusniger]